MFQQVTKAIDNMFSDTSVSVAETKRRLRGLIDHIEMLMDSLPDEDETDEAE